MFCQASLGPVQFFLSTIFIQSAFYKNAGPSGKKQFFPRKKCQKQGKKIIFALKIIIRSLKIYILSPKIIIRRLKIIFFF